MSSSPCRESPGRCGFYSITSIVLIAVVVAVAACNKLKGPGGNKVIVFHEAIRLGAYERASCQRWSSMECLNDRPTEVTAVDDGF